MTGTRNCPFSCLPTIIPFTRPPSIPPPKCFSNVIFVCLHMFSTGHQMVTEEYGEKLQARMEELHNLAMDRIYMASEKMKTRYDARATVHDFHEGYNQNQKRRKTADQLLNSSYSNYSQSFNIYDPISNYNFPRIPLHTITMFLLQ
ncbi:hypothetical protein TNCV_4397761 [Trichonephila clavipes]|nr:hypothetical protein TNCV_4397761 [Trichonephila clavipes]